MIDYGLRAFDGLGNFGAVAQPACECEVERHIRVGDFFAEAKRFLY